MHITALEIVETKI